MKRWMLWLLMILSPVAGAETNGQQTGSQTVDTLEPKVTITPSDGERIIEYRANGRVFMVKIQPVKGPAYFLVDSDGDGSLETKRFSIKDEAFALPHWVLFRW